MIDKEVLICFNIPREESCTRTLELWLDLVSENNIILNIEHWNKG